MGSYFLFLPKLAIASELIRPLNAQEQNVILTKHLWNPSCPVPLSRLRVVTIKYYDFRGQIQTQGQLVVLDSLAQASQKIFAALFQRHFEIAKIRPTSDYNGDDDRSVADDNTSAFNCRPLTGSPKLWSLHAYGAAIDINPIENPYVTYSKHFFRHVPQVMLKAEQPFLARNKHFKGKAENIIDIFQKNGFLIWGGDWYDIQDYQHFQITREQAIELAQDK